MSKVVVYGASDDLIEVAGDFYEEFNPRYDEVKEGSARLAFSDGTLLKVKYDGMWRFTPVVKGAATFTKDKATEDEGSRPDGKPAYSDVVTLEGDVRWVAYGVAYVLPRKRGVPK